MMEPLAAVLRCPYCGVDIPANIAEQPDAHGLTVTYDTTLLEEHTAMHEACTCSWTPLAGRRHNPDCAVHGSPVAT